MKRLLLTTIASSMLVLAVPAISSAAHAKHHHGARHASARRHHAKPARILRFGAASLTAPASGSPSTPAAPSTPANETAGTVTSFTNGVLTITLTDKSTVSGKVTEETRIECATATSPSTEGDDDQGGGDDQSAASGSEHGGQSVQAHSSSNDGQGDEGNGNGHEGDQGSSQENCTTAALVPGAMVREAELSVGSAGAVWEKVDLIK